MQRVKPPGVEFWPAGRGYIKWAGTCYGSSARIVVYLGVARWSGGQGVAQVKHLSTALKRTHACVPGGGMLARRAGGGTDPRGKDTIGCCGGGGG
jgi:hypothetical protein